MISLDEYKELTKLRDRLRRQKDQAQGAYDQILKRIKEELECETKQDLEKLFSKLQKKIKLKLPAFQQAKEKFDKKWSWKINTF